jgi:hypothetical protein
MGNDVLQAGDRTRLDPGTEGDWAGEVQCGGIADVRPSCAAGRKIGARGASCHAQVIVLEACGAKQRRRVAVARRIRGSRPRSLIEVIRSERRGCQQHALFKLIDHRTSRSNKLGMRSIMRGKNRPDPTAKSGAQRRED